jgi:hypothetical protein
MPYHTLGHFRIGQTHTRQGPIIQKAVAAAVPAAEALTERAGGLRDTGRKANWFGVRR